ncbi:ketoacyl-ACP synthase III [Streptomyces sp. H27-D2]|uniref:ketoacyl-ACP synthase III n=1 Tax=Streptomyces sp. H27-D2 TaxID=3046304 RepID=UPI002DBB8B6A|nr:ketoacyl-ACP synthase III [Streptomyces sp. H27-D2]MEC4019142.1 ketoacyl-ACP synthase III [Streptomyces sp. H27-D2]
MSRGIWEGRGIAFGGFGRYFPERCEETPADLPAAPEQEAAILGASLGVDRRHVANEDETISFMAVEAGRMALRDAGLKADQIDLVVFSSWSQRKYAPEDGPSIALRLGARRALAFDVCAACVGFVHGVQTAASLLSSHGWQRALVICSDQFTQRLKPGRRGSYVGGDGAGAAVLQVGPAGEPGLRDSVVLSYGEHAGVSKARGPNGWTVSLPSIAEVASATAGEAVDQVLGRADLKISDVDWVLPHPGSTRIGERLRERIGADPERVLTNLRHRGQTTSASIPTALSEFTESGKLRKGELILAPAAGAGWFSGALLFQL